MKRFQDKVVIVIGATSGMGEASSYRFASEGAKVLVVGRRKKKGEEVVKRIKDNGGVGSFLKADISKKEDDKKIINIAIKRFKKIDVLANIAGWHISKGIEDVSEKEWDFLMDTNIKSFFLIS